MELTHMLMELTHMPMELTHTLMEDTHMPLLHMPSSQQKNKDSTLGTGLQTPPCPFDRMKKEFGSFKDPPAIGSSPKKYCVPWGVVQDSYNFS